MKGMASFSVGKLLGFPIRVNVSFLLLLAVVVVWAGGAAALPFLGVAFASVLLHELGHATVARRLGVRIKEIELHFFGGAAKMLDMPRRPRDEIAIAAAGPGVSLVLAGLALGVSAVSGWDPLMWVGFINLGIAIFNLVPALPMDGGRILRAALTGRMGHLRATEFSVRVARVFAVVLVGLGLWTQHFQLIALAVVLWLMGSAELRVTRLQAAQQEARRRPDPLSAWLRWAEAWTRPEAPRASGPGVRPPQGHSEASVEYLPPPKTGVTPPGGVQARRPLRVVIQRF